MTAWERDTPCAFLLNLYKAKPEGKPRLQKIPASVRGIGGVFPYSAVSVSSLFHWCKRTTPVVLLIR